MIVFLCCFVSLQVCGQHQPDSVLSGVYHWEDPKEKLTEGLSRSILLEGKVHDMEWLQISSLQLAGGQSVSSNQVPVTEEMMLIVKQGELRTTIPGMQKSIGPGSMVLVLPGETCSIENQGQQACEFYAIRYKSKSPADPERGKNAGGSFIKDWNDITFKPHDKGGIRSYFERPTSMGKRLEMHVTTLNPGIKSHDPHTHRAEEIVLMIEGETEMQIGNEFKKGSTGSLYYLGSNVLHAIRNTGSTPCTYFAFQFE